MTSEHSSNKRARSASNDYALPPSKASRLQASQVQINYLARQHKENVPILTINEALPEVLRLVSEYEGVLQRNESMASNLGSCPLGPILLKRFERLFDGPPRVLKSHAKDANVTWLDVVEFAQNKPEQFNLEKQRNGVRVCQFYTKQCRVEISEEDFVLIASGMPQKLIPPQPIPEDEQKELEVLEVLDDRLGQVVQLADQVSARARQLIHKMKSRTSAILDKREVEGDPKQNRVERSLGSPMSPSDANGVGNRSSRGSYKYMYSGHGSSAFSTNDNYRNAGNERGAAKVEKVIESATSPNVTVINGRSLRELSPARRSEHMSRFLTPSEREAGLTEHTIRRSSFGTIRTSSFHTGTGESNLRSSSIEVQGSHPITKTSSSVAIPHTPASLIPLVKPSIFQRDDGGPFKAQMVGRMELMQRGDRVIPPCDRCRRLHMDCLKNLTACAGCTKKHAKCSWKSVRMEELQLLSPATPELERGSDSIIRDDVNPPHSAGSTIEVTEQMEDTSTSLILPNGSRKYDYILRKASNPPFSSPPSQRESPDNPRGPGKFDVRPPPLSQQPQDASSDRRSPSQPSRFSYNPHGEGRDRVDYSRTDEGDRLQALATQVYRSASHNARPPS